MSTLNERTHTIWAEKYRPRTIDEYIGNDNLLEKMRGFIDSDDIPHLLFHGRPGTGKSALAKIIVSQIDCDYMYKNASDENGIETIREDVKHFASSVAMSSLKVIILDEFDHMTNAAQMALRNPMVEYSATTRFILTANYAERIADPIHSRVQDFQITPPAEKEAARLLDRVLREEGVEFDMRDAAVIIKRHYPDLRKILNTAQRMTSNGVLALQDSAVSADRFSRQVVDILADRSADAGDVYERVRQLVADERVRQFQDTYRYMYDELDEFAEAAKAQTILHIANAQHRAQSAPDKEINFMDAIVRIAQDTRS